MFFERFYNTDLAQASYMIGCQKTGECLVIDAVRDIAPYLETAKRHKLNITHVTETHIHADYLSGSRELAHATGAQLLLSDEGDADWKYNWADDAQQGFVGKKLQHGDQFMVGNIKVEARHTDGHTPEHLSFLVTDTPRGDSPVMYFTGDFVFVGEIGRPDLLDEAAGGQDTRFGGAKRMFVNLKEQFLSLPDHVQIWPAHGAGSACGKSLGAVPSSTVGYERATAWWVDYVERGDEQGFTDYLLSGQPDAPLYYGRMKRQNQAGPALLGEVQPLAALSDLQQLRLIDPRPKEEYRKAALPNSVHLPESNTFETWAGWLLRPEESDYALLAQDSEQAERLRRRLWMVGIDNVKGFVSQLDPAKTVSMPVWSAKTLADKLQQADSQNNLLVLDVRNKTEHAEGHIEQAQQLHAGRLAWKQDQLSQDKPIAVHCQSGARSAAAASYLRANGFEVAELAGGYEAWAKDQQEQAGQDSNSKSLV